MLDKASALLRMQLGVGELVSANFQQKNLLLQDKGTVFRYYFDPGINYDLDSKVLSHIDGSYYQGEL